ncbi:MAG: PEP/pyruvate-binding domain-containing protein [Candidatus Dojkabacteria bacterium]
MVGKPKQYVVSLSQIDKDGSKLVGERALLLREVSGHGIPVPSSFVITTEAFDDFIIANDLVSFISAHINEVDYTSEKSVRKTASAIQSAIVEAKVPDLIKSPLEKVYSGIGGLFDAFVTVRTSPVFRELDEVNYHEPYIINNVKGKGHLLDTAKELWARMFSPEALLFRAALGYEGSITQALLVQKMVQAEVSGKVFSVNPANNDKDVIEVQAILGVNDPQVSADLVPDSYFYNKQTEEIIEKKIVGQDNMVVRRGRSQNGSPNTKVAISEIWQKKQKIDDRNIINLGRITSLLEQLYKSEIEIDFAFEAGRLQVIEITPIEKARTARKLNIVEDQLRPIVEKYPSMGQKVKPRKRNVKTAETPAKESDTPKQKEKTMDDYVKEVEKAQQDAPLHQEKPDGDVKYVGEKIVVVVKPKDELDQILEGTGWGKGLSFGLAHFILQDVDWLGLTGDEILVIERLDKKHLQAVNKSKGVVLKSVLKEEELQLIKVPVLHSVDKAMNVLRENEVITLDPEAGAIYLGAGKELSEQPESGIDQSVATEGEGAKAEKTALFPRPVIQEVVAEQKNVIETTGKFWQIYSPDDPKVELLHSNGMFIDLSRFYKSAGLSPEYLLSEPDQRRGFMKSVITVLVPMLQQLENRQAILQASDIPLEELKHLKGSDRMNYDHRFLSGAGKFAADPNLLNMELEILSILRNRESLRNLWFSIPRVNTASELSETKKIVSSYGFRRSSTFKLLATVSTSLSAVSIKSIVENDVDGVIFDYDSIMEDLLGRGEYEIDDNLTKFFTWLIETVNTNRAKPYLLNHKYRIEKAALRGMLEKGLNNFILTRDQLYPHKLLISSLEVKRIGVKKKRGRKKKRIDYGF